MILSTHTEEDVNIHILMVQCVEHSFYYSIILEVMLVKIIRTKQDENEY